MNEDFLYSPLEKRIKKVEIKIKSKYKKIFVFFFFIFLLILLPVPFSFYGYMLFLGIMEYKLNNSMNVIFYDKVSIYFSYNNRVKLIYPIFISLELRLEDPDPEWINSISYVEYRGFVYSDGDAIGLGWKHYKMYNKLAGLRLEDLINSSIFAANVISPPTKKPYLTYVGIDFRGGIEGWGDPIIIVVNNTITRINGSRILNNDNYPYLKYIVGRITIERPIVYCLKDIIEYNIDLDMYFIIKICGKTFSLDKIIIYYEKSSPVTVYIVGKNIYVEIVDEKTFYKEFNIFP